RVDDALEGVEAHRALLAAELRPIADEAHLAGEIAGSRDLHLQLTGKGRGQQRAHNAASTSATSISSKPGSVSTPCGSPVRPLQSTRCCGRAGGPQSAGGTGPKRTTDGVP